MQHAKQKTAEDIFNIFVIQKSIIVLYKPFFFKIDVHKKMEKFGRTEFVILNKSWEEDRCGNLETFSCNCHHWCCQGWLTSACWSQDLGRTWICWYIEPSWILKSFVAPPRGSAVRRLASQVFWLALSCVGILSIKFEKIFCQEAFFLRISLFHEW